MKPFLLIAGDNYYPEAGTRDWIGCFQSQEEAEKLITKTNTGWDDIHIAGCDYGWYEIVDLRKWTG